MVVALLSLQVSSGSTHEESVESDLGKGRKINPVIHRRPRGGEEKVRKIDSQETF